jgi:hypothetical protein
MIPQRFARLYVRDHEQLRRRQQPILRRIVLTNAVHGEIEGRVDLLICCPVQHDSHTRSIAMAAHCY